MHNDPHTSLCKLPSKPMDIPVHNYGHYRPRPWRLSSIPMDIWRYKSARVPIPVTTLTQPPLNTHQCRQNSFCTKKCQLAIKRHIPLFYTPLHYGKWFPTCHTPAITCHTPAIRIWKPYRSPIPWQVNGKLWQVREHLP